jgi:hypothetical protein
MKLAGFAAVAMLLGCGARPQVSTPQQHQIPDRTVATDGASKSGGTLPDGKSETGTGGTCILKPRDLLVVLEIEPLSGRTFNSSEEVTNQIRSQVLSYKIDLSSYRGYPTFEQWDQKCSALPDGDGQCMAAVGRRLSTQWVIWGTLSKVSVGFEVSLQIVSVSDSSHRETKFTFSDRSMIHGNVREALRRLLMH